MNGDGTGSAFPYFRQFREGEFEITDGISRREWFATFAPDPVLP